MWNAFTASNPAVASFVTAHHRTDFGPWQSTQTAPPASISATTQSATSVLVSWTPISYQADPGYYEVLVGPNPEVLTAIGQTPDKATSSFLVTNLAPGTTYWFAVRSITSPHFQNPQTVVSQTGSAVSVTTFPCTYVELSPESTSVTPGGFDGLTFQVFTNTGCPWTAVSNAAWIMVTAGSSGTGTGMVTFNVAANSGPSRSGTITAGGQTFTVFQDGVCSYSLVPASFSAGAGGASGQTFQVQSTAGCAWTAVSNAAWITITAGSSGTGTGTVTFNVAANSGPSRSGTITAGGQTFTVFQDGVCSYSLVPATFSAGAGGASGQTFQVQSAAGCPWSAVSNASWITVTGGSSGTGTGTVTYGVAANTSPGPRSAAIAVAGQSHTVYQSGLECPVISISPPDLPAARVSTPYRLVLEATGGTSPYTWSATVAPGGDLGGISFMNGVFEGLPARVGAYPVTVTVTDSNGCSTQRAYTLSVAACETPAVPEITSSPGTVVAGLPFTVSWLPALSGDPGGTYNVYISRQASCGAPEIIQLKESTLTLTTESGQNSDYCLQVEAVPSQGCRSALSSRVRVEVRVPPPAFAVTTGLPSLTSELGAQAPSRSGEIVVKNVGGVTGQIQLEAIGGFFAVEPQQATVAPGSSLNLSIRLLPGATAAPGVRSGQVRASWTGGSFFTPVTLTVLSGSPTDSAGSRLTFVGTNEIHFRERPGGYPALQTVRIQNTGNRAVRVAPRIGPGGSWLSVAGDFVTPLSPGDSRSFVVTVDRSRRSEADGSPPLVTNLVFLNVDGRPEDAASGQVFDEEPPVSVPGAGRSVLAPGEASVTLGSAVNSTGLGGSLFLSDGWIRNLSTSTVKADLYFTPDGSDGLTGATVRKSTISVGGSSTYRLSDLVKGVFDLDGVSGQVEFRSKGLAQLSIRATADTITKKGEIVSRYGAEIPIVPAGSGVRRVLTAGRSVSWVAVVPAVRGARSDSRTNLILAETLGKQVSVRVKVFDLSGRRLGEVVLPVKAFSKTQINVESVLPSGAQLDTGSVEVWPESGEGSATVFATVIDNKSGSYTTQAGNLFSSDSWERLGTEAAPQTPTAGFLPAVVHSAAANNSFYTTRLHISNPGRESARLTLTYLPDRPLERPVEPVTVTISERAQGPSAWQREDALNALFGITENTAGMLRVDGATGSIVVAAETSTPIDLGDPSKGKAISAVISAAGQPQSQTYGVFSAESPHAVANKSGKRVVSYPALEESLAFRTNLILAEVSGHSLSVLVRAVKPGASGLPAVLGTKRYTLAPYQRLQVNRCLRALVDDTRDGAEFKDVALEVEAVEGSGSGAVVALATRIDNDPDSKRADIYVFGGAEGAGTPISIDDN